MHRIYPVVPAPVYEHRIEILAYHEAGHAAFCEIVGIPYTAIELEHDRGQVLLDNKAIMQAGEKLSQPGFALSEDEEKRYACLAVAMYCAGKQAELLFLGLPLGGVMMFDGEDHRIASALLRKQFGSIAPLGFCQQLARSALSRRWCRVEGLAGQLLKQRIIATG
ncbi:MAG TPA: hypothetical protein VKC56_05670 [Gallionellaceae bacterium]|nr:hypothetical protein [Gallionellaceae bacterium]